MAQLCWLSQEQLERSRPFFSRAFFSRERGVGRVGERKVWRSINYVIRNGLRWSDGQEAKMLRLGVMLRLDVANLKAPPHGVQPQTRGHDQQTPWGMGQQRPSPATSLERR